MSALLPSGVAKNGRRIKIFRQIKTAAAITRNQKKEKLGGTKNIDTKMPTSIATSMTTMIAIFLFVSVNVTPFQTQYFESMTS